jgi:hypothetical protein
MAGILNGQRSRLVWRLQGVEIPKAMARIKHPAG